MTIMTQLACFRTVQGKRRQTATRRSARGQLRMELLEDRLALSGFGIEDGAYIIEARFGRYEDVQVQTADQAIMAAGPALPLDGSAPLRQAVARYDWQGNVDAAYGNSGLANTGLTTAIDLALQADGKAVVSGNVYSSGSASWSLGVARVNTNGTVDASFGSGGLTTLDLQPGMETGYGVGLQSSGKIVVAGNSDSTTPNNPANLVARFKVGGALDSGPGGFGQTSGNGNNAAPVGYRLTTYGLYERYNDLVVRPDNKVVAVGSFVLSDGNSRLVVARYTADGALDKTFNKSGSAIIGSSVMTTVEAQAVALQADGKIVVVGSSGGMDGATDMFVARFTSAGQLDSTFGGGSGYVRLDIDGSASLTQEYARDVAVQPDGKIVVVGRAYPSAPEPTGSVLVARFNTDGTLDTTFSATGFKLATPPAGEGFHFFWGEAVALQSDGSIIVAGFYDTGSSDATSEHYPLLLRFYGSATAAMSSMAMAASSTGPETATRGSESELIVPSTSSTSTSSGGTATGDSATTSSTASTGSTSAQTVGADAISATDAYFTSLGDSLSKALADPLSLEL